MAGKSKKSKAKEYDLIDISLDILQEVTGGENIPPAQRAEIRQTAEQIMSSPAMMNELMSSMRTKE